MSFVLSLFIHSPFTEQQLPTRHQRNTACSVLPLTGYNPAKAKERDGSWPPYKARSKGCVFKCCEKGRPTLLKTGNRGEIHKT